MALFTRTAKLNPGVHGARRARAMAVHRAVGISCLRNSCVVVEYRTRNREVADSTHTRSTASNIEQVANLMCAQANSAGREMSTSYGYGVKA